MLVKWFVYTVLLAMTPMFMRLLMFILVTSKTQFSWLSESDVATFGLILAITNISALETATNIKAAWKTQSMGISLFLISAFATLFAIACFQELQQGVFDRSRVLWANVILSLVSVGYSYAIWNRITIVRIAEEQSDE